MPASRRQIYSSRIVRSTVCGIGISPTGSLPFLTAVDFLWSVAAECQDLTYLPSHERARQVPLPGHTNPSQLSRASDAQGRCGYDGDAFFFVSIAYNLLSLF